METARRLNLSHYIVTGSWRVIILGDIPVLSIVTVRPHLLARFALAFVPFLCPMPLPAQSGAGANLAEVTIDLAAHDKKGNVISDLQSSDVQITDAGVPVTLKSLRPAPPGPVSITFVFDQVEPGVAKTQNALAGDFLAEVVGRGYSFTVLKVEGRLHLVQAPTTNIEAVKAAVNAATMAKRPDYIKVTEAAEKQMTENIEGAQGPRQAAAKALMAMLMDSQESARDPRSTPSVAALLAASRGQQDIPGRKAILYFSRGLVWHSNTPETLRDVTQAAIKARVSIYALDAEIVDESAANALGVTNALGTSQAMGGIASGSLTQGQNATPTAEGPGAGAQANEYAGRQESADAATTPHTLAGICARTGGMHVAAMSAGSKGAAEIAASFNSSYLATWISAGSGDESRLRPIAVKPLRKGMVIDACSGYYPAAHRAGVERVSAAEDKLLAALAAPDLPTDLPMNAAVLRYGNTADNDVDSVMVQVPVEPGGTSTKSVSVLAQLRDASGAVVKKFSADVSSQAPAGDQQAATEMVNFRRQFSAPPGEYVFETAAMDSSGGKIGAQRSNVVIPAAAEGLALGDVLLVKRIDPAGTADETDPLRCTKGLVVPDLSGHISKTTGAKIDLFFILHPDAASTDPPSLMAELRRGDHVIGSLPLKLAADLGGRKTIPYLTTLSAGSLSEGQYEMTITLSQGGQKVSKSVSFTLE